MDDRPLVSVSCITYNHEEYIRDAIEGFLMQETDFPIEIIIHDDASTDRTPQIIEEYAQKFPDLIHAIYQTENQHAKGVGNVSYRFIFPKAKGKYIALCDGDDYWTDPLKLQKQVAFMERYNDCSLCFHPTRVIYENGKRDSEIFHDFNNLEPTVYKSTALLSGNINAWTAALLFRSSIIPYIPEWITSVIYGDIVIKMICAMHGNIGYIGGHAMSVYRRGIKGAWSSNEGTSRKWEEKRLENHLQLIQFFNDYTGHKYEKALALKKSKHIFYYLLRVQDYCSKWEAVKLIGKNSEMFSIKPKSYCRVWLRFFLGKEGYKYLLSVRDKLS